MTDRSFLLEKQNKISIDDHLEKYFAPEFVTACLRENVPLLNYVDWQIIEVKEGYCKTLIPYEKKSKNQNATHQAALYLLAADYTGGISISNHIKLPAWGVYPNEFYDDFGLIFFTLHSEVTFKKVSTKNMIAIASINQEEREIIKTNIYKKGRIIKSVDIELRNDDEALLGKVKMKYLMSLLSHEEWGNRNNHK